MTPIMALSIVTSVDREHVYSSVSRVLNQYNINSMDLVDELTDAVIDACGDGCQWDLFDGEVEELPDEDD